ncbi:hypothetical protein LPJ59_005794 [Coemansia sp. RSA 2399]|nr:hypothetical protein LPJ59_005794 [Coemansia sp. RSA 2399]
MGGAGRTPTPTAPAPPQQLQPTGLLHPQQHQPQPRHSLSVMQPTRQQPPFAEQPQHRFHARQSPMIPHRLPDAYAATNVSSVSASAFSPIAAARGSPMAMSPPPMAQHQSHAVHQQHHYHHLQARPSSVGPASTYHTQHGGVHSAGGSPAMAYSREISPQRVAVPLSQGASIAAASRQRKPSAPPPLPPGGASTYVRGSGRSSISSNYAPYNIPPQQQQMPIVGSHSGRVPYASPSLHHHHHHHQQQQQHQQLPAAPIPPVSREPQYADGTQYSAGYAEMPQAPAVVVAPHGYYQQQHPQQQQQQQPNPAAPAPYYQQQQQQQHPPNSHPPPYR